MDFFFPWPQSSWVHERGVNSLKNVYFFDTYPLNSMSYFRGSVSVLEIVFVGQCEVFVCLDFVWNFFPLATKLI